MKEEVISTTQVQNNFGAYLAQVKRQRQPIFVERHGKPVAVLLGYEAWQELKGEKIPQRSVWVEAARQFSERVAKNHRKSSPPAVELIRELREENS